MSIAALYDIHANLPALEAVAHDLREAGVDRVIVGGDVVPGPMPCETLDFLLNLPMPVQFIQGNGELSVLAEAAATDDPTTVRYSGTITGEPLPPPLRQLVRWTAHQLDANARRLLASWPKTLRLDIEGLGRVLFCHGTPRSEIECFTRLTPEALLLPVFADIEAELIICGHTHMQFDRRIGPRRVVNAGSVGMPFQHPPGAYWLQMGSEVQLRHTIYDLSSAAERVRATLYPQVEQFAARNILNPPNEADMLKALTLQPFP